MKLFTKDLIRLFGDHSARSGPESIDDRSIDHVMSFVTFMMPVLTRDDGVCCTCVEGRAKNLRSHLQLILGSAENLFFHISFIMFSFN